MQKFHAKKSRSETYHTGTASSIKDGDTTIELIRTNCGKTLYPSTVEDVSDKEDAGEECIPCLRARLTVNVEDEAMAKWEHDHRMRTPNTRFENHPTMDEVLKALAEQRENPDRILMTYRMEARSLAFGAIYDVRDKFARGEETFEQMAELAYGPGEIGLQYTYVTREQVEWIKANPHYIEKPIRGRRNQLQLR